jgi:hypothetical protein
VAASAETAFAPEPVFAKKLQGVLVTFEVRLKDVTGRGTGESDKGHTELPTSRPTEVSYEGASLLQHS